MRPVHAIAIGPDAQLLELWWADGSILLPSRFDPGLRPAR
jgi:hypothetical protein